MVVGSQDDGSHLVASLVENVAKLVEVIPGKLHNLGAVLGNAAA